MLSGLKKNRNCVEAYPKLQKESATKKATGIGPYCTKALIIEAAWYLGEILAYEAT